MALSIDGLQPEKGHETLYVVRELRKGRVWFAESLLSSAADDIRPLFEKAREWAEKLGKPVRVWTSDKQEAFVTGVEEVFPGVPHRYCSNHFLRDLAKPTAETEEAEAAVETSEKAEAEKAEAEEAERRRAAASDVVLDYCAAVRGILNHDHGGPLDPPGLRMADALTQVQASLRRNLELKKGARPRSS